MSENIKEVENNKIEEITIKPLVGKDLKLVSLIASKLDLDVKDLVNKFLEVRKKVMALESMKNKEEKKKKHYLLWGILQQ